MSIFKISNNLFDQIVNNPGQPITVERQDCNSNGLQPPAIAIVIAHVPQIYQPQYPTWSQENPPPPIQQSRYEWTPSMAPVRTVSVGTIQHDINILHLITMANQGDIMVVSSFQQALDDADLTGDLQNLITRLSALHGRIKEVIRSTEGSLSKVKLTRGETA
jgi:hypothetical protein